MKLLTITVPCYNSQDYMRNCLESLLAGGDRVEIIIINDGSKDNTGKIADEYAQKYPHIVKVIHQENGGHGEGINQGLKHATGTYFKVVDSDDKMSDDFVSFLDALEWCEENGGVDLFNTNYFYTHADGIGDRSISYHNVLPEDRIVGWSETRPFRVHQMITLHSGTFRTELMRKWPISLPKHTFYEDNLMVHLTLPYIQRIYYMNCDLYRYTIGREGQSVAHDAMKKRYSHQILVTEQCFTSCHLDEIKNKRQQRYMRHELFMMFAISILFTRLNKSTDTDVAIEKMWRTCMDFDPKWAKRYRNGLLWFLCIPGKFGQNFSCFIYKFANKIVRFN